MSRWRPEPAALGLDATRLVGVDGVLLDEAPAAGWDAVSLQAALQRQQAAGAAAVRLLVGADLCKHFVHQAPAGVATLAELQALTALRAAQLFGGLATDWAVVADWQLARAFACAALPQSLLHALREAARALGLRLAVESALLVALHRVLQKPPSGGFIAWTTPRHRVLVGLAGGAVSSLRCTHRGDAMDEGGAAHAWARDAAREALIGGQAADASCFDAQAALPAAPAGDSEAAWAQRLAQSA